MLFRSPIDIQTARTVKTTLPTIETRIQTTLQYVRNTGKGFQLFEESPAEYRYDPAQSTKIKRVTKGSSQDATTQAWTASSTKGYSMIGGSKYDFFQVNWHTPSENTIDGKNFAMEAHFVHELSDYKLHGTPRADPPPPGFSQTHLVDTKTPMHRLAVISLLYDLGTDQQCNTFLNSFWGLFPESTGVAQFTGVNPDLNAKLSNELALGYYHWYGSMTVPPCTEGVSWNLLKTPEHVCQAQVTVLTKALSESQLGVPFNNRVTQPLNHRAVALMEPGNPRAAPTNYKILPAAATAWYYAGDGTNTAVGTTIPTASSATVQKLWGGLCVAGHEQSPINILTAETVKPILGTYLGTPTLATNMGSTLTGPAYVRNNGRGFQLFERRADKYTYNAAQAAATPIRTDGTPSYADRRAHV